jgi:hypothetical protein
MNGELVSPVRPRRANPQRIVSPESESSLHASDDTRLRHGRSNRRRSRMEPLAHRRPNSQTASEGSHQIKRYAGSAHNQLHCRTSNRRRPKGRRRKLGDPRTRSALAGNSCRATQTETPFHGESCDSAAHDRFERPESPAPAAHLSIIRHEACRAWTAVEYKCPGLVVKKFSTTIRTELVDTLRIKAFSLVMANLEDGAGIRRFRPIREWIAPRRRICLYRIDAGRHPVATQLRGSFSCQPVVVH